MSWELSVIGLWVAFLCGLVGYFGRKKKFGPPFQTIAIAFAFISLILFLWWAVLRMIGAIE